MVGGRVNWPPVLDAVTTALLFVLVGCCRAADASAGAIPDDAIVVVRVNAGGPTVDLIVGPDGNNERWVADVSVSASATDSQPRAMGSHMGSMLIVLGERVCCVLCDHWRRSRGKEEFVAANRRLWILQTGVWRHGAQSSALDGAEECVAQRWSEFEREEGCT